MSHHTLRCLVCNICSWTGYFLKIVFFALSKDELLYPLRFAIATNASTIMHLAKKFKKAYFCAQDCSRKKQTLKKLSKQGLKPKKSQLFQNWYFFYCLVERSSPKVLKAVVLSGERYSLAVWPWTNRLVSYL